MVISGGGVGGVGVPTLGVAPPPPPPPPQAASVRVKTATAAAAVASGGNFARKRADGESMSLLFCLACQHRRAQAPGRPNKHRSVLFPVYSPDARISRIVLSGVLFNEQPDIGLLCLFGASIISLFRQSVTPAPPIVIPARAGISAGFGTQAGLSVMR